MRRMLIAAALMLAACDSSSIQGPFVIQREPIPNLAPHDLPAFFDCVRERGATVVSAHRGRNAAMTIENAIQSFESTLAGAPAFLEVDVARTRDNVLVLMHDDTVDRTTSGEGAVGSMIAQEFSELRFVDDTGAVMGFGPPTLREALDWADGKTVLELDVKRGVSYEDVVRDVEAANAMGRVIFITYSVDGASRIASIAPNAMIYTTIRSVRDLDTLERRGVDLAHIVAWLGDEELDEDLLRALNARGVEGRWGLFRRNADFAAAVEAGAEGVSVNDPVAAYRAIDAADGQDGYAAAQCALSGDVP